MELRLIAVEKIRPNPYQPREGFDKELIEELAASIKSLDLLEPLIVRPAKGGFEIACGERRWRAAQMAKLDKIPAIVRDLDDRKLQLYSVVENLHRLDLTSTEKEKAISRLWSLYKKEKKSIADLARDIGLSASWVGELLSAHEERKGLDETLRDTVTTKDLKATRGLAEPVRRQLLKEKSRGRLAEKDMEDLASIAKEAPKDKQRTIVEAATREIGEVRDLVKEEAKAFAKGELEAREIKAVLDADQRRVNRFLETRNSIIFDWTIAAIEMMQAEKLREKAVEYVEEVRDHCDKLLDQLKRRGWYAR